MTLSAGSPELRPIAGLEVEGQQDGRQSEDSFHWLSVVGQKGGVKSGAGKKDCFYGQYFTPCAAYVRS